MIRTPPVRTIRNAPPNPETPQQGAAPVFTTRPTLQGTFGMKLSTGWR